jgi:hypothetical protein
MYEENHYKIYGDFSKGEGDSGGILENIGWR